MNDIVTKHQDTTLIFLPDIIGNTTRNIICIIYTNIAYYA